MSSIPQSPALGEAKVDSLNDLLSSDPMGHTRQRRDAVIAELRERRKGWEAVENAGGHKKAARSAAAKVKAGPQVAKQEMDI